MKTTFLLSTLASSALSQTCYDGVRVLIARGTGEPQNSSVANLMGRAILASIPDSYSNEIIYPASSDPNGPNIGAANAQSQIYDYARACPEDKIVLIGYSQGAVVVGNAIAGAQPVCNEVANNIVAVVLFGDPGRVQGVGVDSDVNGPSCNVAANAARSGQSLATIEQYEDRLSEWCNYDDFVCCATGTTFAAHLSYWTDANADAVASYVSSKAASATVTSAELASSCTAISARITTATGAATSGSMPVGSGVGSSAGRNSAMGVASGTAGGTAPTVRPTMPPSPTSGSPGIVTQTVNAAVKNQADVVGAAAAALAGALLL